MPHNLIDPDPRAIRWFIVGGLLAMLMSLATDLTDERRDGPWTRLARAVLNGVFALGVAAALLRWVQLAPVELVLLSAVLGSLGREFSFAAFFRIWRAQRRGHS